MLIVGLAGMLFTVFLFLGLFYYVRHSPSGVKNTVELVKLQLDQVVKDLEFYKLQKGSYPDRLVELMQPGSLSPIVDPFKHHEKSNYHFNYKKFHNS